MPVSNEIQIFIDSIGTIGHDGLIIFFVGGVKYYLCDCIDIYV